MARRSSKPAREVEAELEQAAEQLRRHCRQQGMRFTRERVDVLRAVIEADGHFDPDQMLAYARRRGIRTSRATLYRTLSVLEEAGIIQQVLPGHRHRHYEYVFDRPAHDHIVNLNTGQIIEFESETLAALRDAICRAHGLRAVKHRLMIYAEDETATADKTPARRKR